jgi:7-carboxy-7-deazaguanine synthase
LSLKVNEIFYSIQGESSYVGWPCTFIRLTGCNLRCSYCDTTYAYSEAAYLSISEIALKVSSFKCPLVEVTGGEPLIQKETTSLISELLVKGYNVLLETNGTQDISKVDPRCVRIVDIKCPSSGQAQKNDVGNLKRLTEKDEIKFVIGSKEDFEYAKGMLGLIPKPVRTRRHIHFSPVFGKMELEKLAKWILNDHLEVRLQVQLHKIIWSPARRGV